MDVATDAALHTARWLPLEQRALWWLRRLPRWLTVVVGVVAVLGVPVLAYLALTLLGVNATGASVLVAVAAGIGAVVQSRRQERRQTTIQLLGAFQTADVLAEADRRVAALVRSELPVDASLSGADDEALITLLDYYELLARLMLSGQVDRHLLLVLRGDAMRALWRQVGPYVQGRSERYDAELYEALRLLLGPVTAGGRATT